MFQVLIVDDDPGMRELLEVRLRLAGHSVVTVRDGVEAIHALRSTDPDLVIVDWRMPVINGPELCRMIRGSAPFGHVPIVLLSGLDPGPELDSVLGLGGIQYLRKDLDWGTLGQHLEECLTNPPR